MYILDKLNDCQKKAVIYNKSNLMVLAGAGSGKTRVLTHRFAWLMHEHELRPHNIMAVTFTNKAARELKTRIEQMTKARSGDFFVGTFHGLAHRLLRTHWHQAHLPENFQVIDSDDQLRIIKRLLKELSIDDSRWPPKQVQSFISKCKDQGMRSGDVTGDNDYYQRTLSRVYVEYEKICQSGGIVDFGELLLKAYELWRDNGDLLEHYRKRLSHVLVDEFQDTNDIQYLWLKKLTGKHEVDITVVGDDDQSIYGWRGAKIENIQNFSKDYHDVEIIRLEQNYRSTNTILNAANAIIAHNVGRLGKTLWTASGDGDKIDLYCAYNDLEEARFVVEKICDYRTRNLNYSDMAVLYRSNAQSRSLEEMLLHMQVPYRIYGGLRFYDRSEIKNAIAYLRMLANPDDDTAFERIINLPTRGIGEQSLSTIRECSRENRISLWQALNTILKSDFLPSRAHNACDKFVSIIAALQQKTIDSSLAEQAEIVVKDSGLYDFHGREKGKMGESRLDNLQELFRACKQFADESDSENKLIAFIDHAALESGEGQADEYTDSVQLMSLHSAKGLEFPLVFMTGLEDGLFPHRMCTENEAKLEEERRLCYVGITRAMQKLYISYAQTRYIHGSQVSNTASRFVAELPESLINEVRIKSSFRRPDVVKSPAYQHKQFGKQGTYKHLDSPFAIGSKVAHPLFGGGVIRDFEGEGDKTRVQVSFRTQGTKWLMLTYAKLQAYTE